VRAIADTPFLDLLDLVFGLVSEVLGLVFGGEEGGTGVWEAHSVVPERPVGGVELDILILPDSVPRILFSLLLQDDSRVVLKNVVSKPSAAHDCESDRSEKRGEGRVAGHKSNRHWGIDGLEGGA